MTDTTAIESDAARLKARKVYTVSRLNQEVRALIETGFATVWLQGELSNFSRPASGHFYFTLKDSSAQIRCAMFRSQNSKIGFEPRQGDQIIVRGKLSLYQARGDFQLIADHMEPAGEGRLQARYEATVQRLNELGWFDVALKRSPPALPQTIGVVTSPTGAALQDVLQVLKRRYPQATVIIYPTQTQGAAAAPAITRALQRAQAHQKADVLLLVRGGGSLEDLWAFNDIAVAEAIRAITIPVISGIGHEIDVTISDLIADQRAPTPSAAAELATPDNTILQQRVRSVAMRLKVSQARAIDQFKQRLNPSLARLQLQHPQRKIDERSQRVDELSSRLSQVTALRLATVARQLEHLDRRLRLQEPQQLLKAKKRQLEHLRQALRRWIDQRLTVSRQHLLGLESSLGAVPTQQRIDRSRHHQKHLKTRLRIAMQTTLDKQFHRLESTGRALHAVSPLAVLGRGYALVKHKDSLVTQVDQIALGDEVTIRLARGELIAEVRKTIAS